MIWNFLNRLVKVPVNFNSYKPMLKKHTRGIAGFSFCKEATLITAKKMILYIFKHLIPSIIKHLMTGHKGNSEF